MSPLRLSAFLAIFLILGCSTLSARKKVEIRSVPSGAEVRTLKGDSIGTTPLTLDGDSLAKHAEFDKLLVVLSYPNYIQRELVVDVHGSDMHEVTLDKLDNAYFATRLIKEYAPQNNQMIRELLRLQGLLIIRKLDQAEQGLETFSKTYPSVAATYVMLANVAQMRGNSKGAESFLLRAQSLDPADPVIERMLNQVSRKKAGN